MMYQVMPELTTDEYAELKEDIAQRGVMVPIEFDECGNVLDGHHRLMACKELGIKDYPKVIRAGMTECEKRTHARKLNMARRHLTQDQRREMIRQQLSETPERSDRQIAAGLGVSHPTVGSIRAGMEERNELERFTSSIGADGKQRPRKPVSVFNPTRREEKAIKDPEVISRMAETGTASPVTASKAVNRERKDERKTYSAPTAVPNTCRLLVADIRSGLREIEDGSIDFIITDPPYPKEYIPLYSELSKLAARVLKPGGSLIAMCGQSYLPEVMAAMCEHMQYHWCLSYLTPGGQSPQLWHKRLNTFWKPVLWFTKGRYEGEYVGDVLKSPPNENDKEHHHWGQSVGGFLDIVERFTLPGQTILDPFLGGGTTGVAAVMTGREFIGADINPENIDITQDRLKEVISHAGSKTGTDWLEG